VALVGAAVTAVLALGLAACGVTASRRGGADGATPQTDTMATPAVPGAP